MDIKRNLQGVYILQDSITWLNSEGREESEDALALLEERNTLVREIVAYVEHLKKGLQLIVDKPRVFNWSFEVAQEIAKLALGGPKKEEASLMRRRSW